MRIQLALLISVTWTQAAFAQGASATPRAQVVVSGVVRDSLAHHPLARASVQIASADSTVRYGRTVIADSLGRYAFDSVPAGRYILGFFHPVLDSVGVEAPLREVVVSGLGPVRADLSTPSPARLRAAICGPSTSDSTALVVGTVRDARDGSAAVKVEVAGEWLDFTISRQGLSRRMQRLVATTGENGWFAICNVPAGGTILLTASRGADSTDRIEVQIPADGFARRELYLGAARTAIVSNATGRTDSLAAPARRIHLGSGRLTGTVVRLAGGLPLLGAQVRIAEGPQTLANARGEWTIVDAPLGTRMLEVRAVGYYPERRRVDVIAGAAPVHVSLTTLKSVLDTIRVTASGTQNRELEEFAFRARSGAGTYITAADIARQNPMVTTDLFRRVSSVRLDLSAMDSTSITMRGGTDGFSNSCIPGIYVDGMLMSGISADEIDGLVRARELAGIEIYTETTVPLKFQRIMTGCGSIVIWRK